VTSVGTCLSLEGLLKPEASERASGVTLRIAVIFTAMLYFKFINATKSLIRVVALV
jgi:hypothetical protein